MPSKNEIRLLKKILCSNNLKISLPESVIHWSETPRWAPKIITYKFLCINCLKVSVLVVVEQRENMKAF